MWKPEHRRAADRHGLRYPSDLSDGEWALIEPAIPPAKRGGRRREVNVREVLNAIFYVLSTGCQWQALPKDLPPKSTAHSYASCLFQRQTLVGYRRRPGLTFGSHGLCDFSVGAVANLLGEAIKHLITP